MFGLQNLGVINQKNAPAIWIGEQAFFPVNNILGRILIASDNGSIWLDTSNSSREVIVAGGNGTMTFENGLIQGAIDAYKSYVRMGGTLIENTEIGLSGFDITFGGSSVDTTIKSSGYLKTGGRDVLTIAGVAAGVTVPNKTITINVGGASYQVNAL